jgi:uncharacterized membrane protein YuzA (DUF378 family)
MKYLDITVMVLLIIGGLNWGLVGFFEFDLVAWLLGPLTFLSRLVYALVGLAAIYEAVSLRAVMHRWHCTARLHPQPVTTR